MKIPDKIRRAIINRLNEINLNNFSQDTIKLLLIEIRDYLSQNSPLKEIAHFVAHPERDRGLILDTVNYAYNRSRVLFRQLEGKKSRKGLELDINELPIDIFETVIWHFSRIKPNTGKLNKFKSSFELDKSSNFYKPKRLITDKTIKYIKEAISIFSLQPALSQKDIMNEIISTIKRLGLTEYSKSLIEHQNYIMICILSILHQSSFILKDGNIAEANLSNEPIAFDLKSNSEANLINQSIVFNLEGKVFLSAIVKTELSHASIAFTLVSSDVTIRESFSKSLMNMDFGLPRIIFDKSDQIEAVRNEDGKIVFVKLNFWSQAPA